MKSFKVNIRMVYAMRSNGTGYFFLLKSKDTFSIPVIIFVCTTLMEESTAEESTAEEKAAELITAI